MRTYPNDEFKLIFIDNRIIHDELGCALKYYAAPK
jgi:hypothetical protein